MIYESIIDSPIWPELKPHLDIHHNNAPGGWRINVLESVPVGVARRAFKTRVKCSCETCGKSIFPIRQGKGWHNIYYASSCPQTISIKCSRTKGAVKACAKVRAAVLQ